MKQVHKLTKWIVIGLPVVVLAWAVNFEAELFPEEPTALSWTAPAETENGEMLTDLAGYQVHCWAAASQYTTSMHVDDPAATNLVIEQLPSGTYKCAVSAFTVSGDVSALSNVVATSVR